MKKVILLSLIFILLFSLVSVNSTYAGTSTALGTLSYWYSDKSSIGRWNKSTIKVYRYKINDNGDFYFVNGIEYACDQWMDALDITLSDGSTSAYSSAPIKAYGGTKAEINALGVVTISDSESINGKMIYTSTTEGYWTYGSTTITGKKISKATIVILDNDRTVAQYKKTCTHEMGHALGWFGHSSYSTDIMYSKGSSVTSLTTRDKRQLVQVYD